MENTELAYRYLISQANSDRYKVQNMAVLTVFDSMFGAKFTSEDITNYLDQIDVGSEAKYIRDLVYKSDFMTPRQSVLFPPNLFLLYTSQVFSMLDKLRKSASFDFYKDGKINFSTENISVFYTGVLGFDNIDFRNDTNYRRSYYKFQIERSTFKNSKVLKVDIQNFFSGVTLSRLEKYLNLLATEYEVDLSSEVDTIMTLFRASNYANLPQNSGSIASSLLSQLYLIPFTNFLNNISKRFDLKIVRYVDDMYIRLPDGIEERQVNNLIGIISSELWKHGLSLNINKLKLFDKDSYDDDIDFANVATKTGSTGSLFLNNQSVITKIEQLINDGELSFEQFLDEVCGLYKTYGNDMLKYKEVVKKFFSIDEDNEGKVQNAFIFGSINGAQQKYWQRLPVSVLKKFVEFPEIITFDPSKYMTFIIMVRKYLSIINVNHEETLIDSLSKWMGGLEDYTVRDGLIDSSYYVQTREFIDSGATERISELDENYLYFINRYILKNDK